MRKLISGILGAAMLLCVSGCAGEVGNPVLEPSKEVVESVESTSPAAAVVKTDEKVTEVTVGENSSFSIRFIDVGQADSALIECDGHYMLIDGGNRDDSDLIYSVLKQEEASHLDMIVGTHAHEDHIGGLPGALNYATADITLSPVTEYDSKVFTNFKKYAEMNGGGLTVPAVGDEYELGSADVKILGVNSGSDTNNTSIVLKITYGETTFLFTGDAEREAEQVILESGADLSATVLKVGHHGSDTSTSYPFLREIMPKYAVISVGEGNSYGHPTDDTLSRLRDADVEVYRTDLQGDIICRSDGKNVTFETERRAESTEIMNAGSTSVTGTAASTEMTYILNTSSEKFHLPSCKSASQMKEENRSEFTGTREELIDMGYSPCGSCNP